MGKKQLKYNSEHIFLIRWSGLQTVRDSETLTVGIQRDYTGK